MSSAADAATSAVEGVPWWATLIGSVVVAPLIGVFVAYLRRLLRVEEPTGQPSGDEAPTQSQQEAVPMSQPQTPTVAPPPPDPEIALIATMVERLHAELGETRAQIVAANREHSRAMAAAEEQHRASMAAVTAQLRDRDETIAQLRSMLDVLTGRRPPQQYPSA